MAKRKRKQRKPIKRRPLVKKKRRKRVVRRPPQRRKSRRTIQRRPTRRKIRSRPKPAIRRRSSKRRTLRRRAAKKKTVPQQFAPSPAQPRGPADGVVRGGGHRFVLDNSFEFLYELRDLILKSSPAEKHHMIQRINRLGRVKLAIIAGIFVNKENPDPTIADLLIVGDVDTRKLRVFLKALEAEVGKEIKFAVLEKDEFQYRLSMFDRFIRVLLESPHEKLINRLNL